MIDICELLFTRGLPAGKWLTKFVRHSRKIKKKGHEWDLQALHQENQLELYQSNQGEDIFPKDGYVVSFFSERHSQALLLGVYKVCHVEEAPERKWPADYLYQKMPPGRFWYDLTKMPGFEDLEKRVVINWGKSPISWQQWLSPREVVEILPTGYVQEFPGFDDVLLTYGELQEIVAHPAANREWHRALSSVFGIYLITCMSDGSQYVGSAYNAEGILGRWKNYAATGHGGNRWLKPLIPDDFQFSILRSLPTTLTTEEVIAVERIYMKKLGSRAHGLNS